MNGQWQYRVVHFGKDEVHEMCFPNENYDYDDLDVEFDDCCGVDVGSDEADEADKAEDAEKSEEKAEEPAEDEAATEEDADVEVQLDAIEEPVEDVDKE